MRYKERERERELIGAELVSQHFIRGFIAIWADSKKKRRKKSKERRFLVSADTENPLSSHENQISFPADKTRINCPVEYIMQPGQKWKAPSKNSPNRQISDIGFTQEFYLFLIHSSVLNAVHDDLLNGKIVF